MILSTLMQPIVRTAKARIRGLGSCESCKRSMESEVAQIKEQQKLTLKVPKVTDKLRILPLSTCTG